jgi:hypothetical protein
MKSLEQLNAFLANAETGPVAWYIALAFCVGLFAFGFIVATTFLWFYSKKRKPDLTAKEFWADFRTHWMSGGGNGE